VFETPAIETEPGFAAEQVCAAQRERCAIDDKSVEFIWFATVLAGDTVEARRERFVSGIIERAHQDRLMHRAHAIAGANARFAACGVLQPYHFRQRPEAPSARNVLGVTFCDRPARRPQQQETIAAGEPMHRQRFDAAERHHDVMRIGALLRAGNRIVFEVPRRIGNDDIVRERVERVEGPDARLWFSLSPHAIVLRVASIYLMRLRSDKRSFAAIFLICLQTMLLPKLYVEGSIPFARSNFLRKGAAFWRTAA
jgi:hypothetical protein